MTDVQKDVHITADESPKAQESSLIEALKTASRLVPRQINDEIALAKLELEHKKARVGGVAIAAGLALGFHRACWSSPWWWPPLQAWPPSCRCGFRRCLSAQHSWSVIGLSGLIGYRKFKSLLPLLPEHAWRGIRHDLGIAKEGRDFDPATLDPEPLTKEEKKARQGRSRRGSGQGQGGTGSQGSRTRTQGQRNELIERTSARRAHLLTLREELVDQADVKKQAGYLIDNAKGRAMDVMNQAAAGAAEQAGHAVETIKERWKPLAVLAVSAGACALLLRKLLKKYFTPQTFQNHIRRRLHGPNTYHLGEVTDRCPLVPMRSQGT